MSIWSSVLGPNPTLLDNVPYRDNYTGEPTGEGTFLVDVATTPWYHSCIRINADGIISTKEAQELVARLLIAIAAVEAEHPPVAVIETTAIEVVAAIGDGS